MINIFIFICFFILIIIRFFNYKYIDPHNNNSLEYLNNIFIFWTGNNSLSENRIKSLESLKAVTGANIILITPNNLYYYIKPYAPLHPAYDYLSLVHKSDYLRSYFMYHYGGGYSDIKRSLGSWKKGFELIKNVISGIENYKY